MPDPLVVALALHNAYTPADIARAIRYRRELARELLAEVRTLRRLLRQDPDVAAIRAERDPPYVEA